MVVINQLKTGGRQHFLFLWCNSHGFWASAPAKEVASTDGDWGPLSLRKVKQDRHGVEVSKIMGDPQ